MATIHVKSILADQERLKAVREISSWASKIHFAYAWVSSAEGQAVHFNHLDLSKLERGVVGLHFAQTEPAALEYFRELAPGVRVMPDADGVFHPKVLVGVRGASARMLLGSSNFTVGGFGRNDESNLLLEGAKSHPAFADVLSQIRSWWSDARPIDARFLRQYRIEHRRRATPERYRPMFRRRHQTQSHPLESLAYLTFDEFLARVRRAEGIGDALFDTSVPQSLASPCVRIVAASRDDVSGAQRQRPWWSTARHFAHG